MFFDFVDQKKQKKPLSFVCFSNQKHEKHTKDNGFVNFLLCFNNLDQSKLVKACSGGEAVVRLLKDNAIS